MLGSFQRRNAATAIVALERAVPPALAFTPDDVAAGFARLVIPGRMEAVCRAPSGRLRHRAQPRQGRAGSPTRSARSFPDGASRSSSRSARAKTPAVLERWFALPAGYVFTRSTRGGRNAVRPQRLAGIAQAHGFHARAVADPVEALSIARRMAGPDDVVVVSGSTFLVATLRDWWLTNVGELARQGSLP